VTADEGSARLAALVRADRLSEAADLAERLGRTLEAARLWEQACAFGNAARCRLAAGDAASAVVLAARAGADELERAALDVLRDTPARAKDAANRLADANLFAAAARASFAAGDFEAAGGHFESAADPSAAADAYERAGLELQAARCLERALEAQTANAGAALRLGRLLAQAGRPEHAARVLQRIPREAVERAAALEALIDVFSDLAMPEAVRELERERSELGPAPVVAEPTPVRTSERVLFGRYRVERLVAVTPTARVYEAFDRVSSQRVALKLLSTAAVRDAGRDALRQFEREALALGKLRHAAIVALLDYVADGPVLVLEWMEGGSLAELLSRGPIAPARAVEIARALLSALAEAHRRGILHRDLKPSNVLFDGAGATHLSDFGVAHVGERATTITAGLLGTLAYMAPEQRAGAPASVQSDVYGVGAILWHCLTDGPPEARLSMLSGEIGAAAVAAAERLIAPAAERPGDTASALEILRAASWPSRVPERRAASLPPAAPVSVGERYERRTAPLFFDRLLGMTVLIPAGESALVARARAFARADHPALSSVLAFDEASARLVLQDLGDDPLEGALAAAELAELREAIVALHRAGGVHGCLDRAHLARWGGRVVVRFPLVSAGSEADDLAALETLGE
jgi:serine/threonine-protein kinase